MIKITVEYDKHLPVGKVAQLKSLFEKQLSASFIGDEKKIDKKTSGPVHILKFEQ